mmetsp:Transcript_16496/g.37879  ORF Transcript_16496/g.37879 Transcript_16496/m.37879 type:complete len:243 (-) Transcript_16496:60-788(-)
MHQKSSSNSVISVAMSEMQQLCLLQGFVVDTESTFASSPVLLHSFSGGTINRGGFPNELLPVRKSAILVDVSFNIIQGLGVLRVLGGRERCHALFWIPIRNDSYLSEVAFQASRDVAVALAIPLRSVLWREHHVAIRVFEIPLRPFSSKKLFHGDDLKTYVFLRDGFHVEEMRKRKVLPLATAFVTPVLVEQIHGLFRRQYKRTTHRRGHCQHGLHCHSNVVPSPMIGFKCNVLFFVGFLEG